MKKWALIVFAALAGCSSTEQSTQLYLLPQAETAQNEVAQPSKPLLVVRNIDIADYLNESSLVYRTSDTQVVKAKYNRWAESLSEQLNQRIVNDLRHKQTKYWPVKMSSVVKQTEQAKLQLNLQRFNGSYTGNAELSGVWSMIDGQGQVVYSQPFNLTVPLQEEGYASLVEALSQGVDQLTTKIADTL